MARTITHPIRKLRQTCSSDARKGLGRVACLPYHDWVATARGYDRGGWPHLYPFEHCGEPIDHSHGIDRWIVGDSAASVDVVRAEDVARFVELTADDNPSHVDEIADVVSFLLSPVESGVTG